MTVQHRTYSGPIEIDGQTITAAPTGEHDTRLVDELERYVVAADPTLDLGTDVLVGPPDRRLAELTADAGPDQSEAALEFAFEMAAAHKVPLWLVHVWDVPTPHAWGTAAISGVHDRWKEIAVPRLDEVAEQWQRKHPEVDVHQKMRQSHPVLGLLGAAASTDAQLIVAGGHWQSRMTGLLLGSVARGVLRHADVPVAVVHESRPEV
jgi:nucleotide-binding universal stress UspA family protein